MFIFPQITMLQKIQKYQDLCVELEHLCKMKTFIVPVVMGALGCVSQSFLTYSSNLNLCSINTYYRSLHCLDQSKL